MSKKTQTRLDIIYKAIGDGLSQKDAAILAGIDESTLYIWKKDDQSFSSQIEQKEIEYKQRHIENIKKASDKNWQASAWWLERKHKKEFAQKIENENDLNITIKTTNYGDNNSPQLPASEVPRELI
jgi:sensor c-di-GMP phosphodiesterase-like protein